MKHVVYTADAAKDLRRHGNMAKRVMKAISDYAADQKAHANKVLPLSGINAKRMRVGEFRVIFEETAAQITVTKVGPRGGVYE